MTTIAPLPIPPAPMSNAAPKSPNTPSAKTWDVKGKHLYLIGIGGCGMSGLARMLKGRGAVVAGSDKESSDATDALRSEGFGVGFQQDAGVLPEACDLVIASAAIRPDHPEMLAAQRRGIPTLMYAEALGKCMLGRTGLGIAGTHGKSTTVAMLGYALIQAGIDPTVIVGATCAQLAEPRATDLSRATDLASSPSQCSVGRGSTDLPRTPSQSHGTPGSPTGFRLGAQSIPSGPLTGHPGVLLAEACEFNRSFHNLHPSMGVILNVEADHLDVYGSLEAVIEAFRDYARMIPSATDGGWLLIGHEGSHRREVTGGVTCEVETIGFAPDADWVVSFDRPTRRISLTHKGNDVASWTLRLPGQHMAYDSAVAMAVAVRLGANPAKVGAALSNFRGVDRRMQFLGEKNPGGITRAGVRVYDDYGHHPTEIDATLRSLREFERPEDRNGRLICVFQPHQHSRTRFLLEEFAQSFSHADVVIVPHIYFVRDSEIEKSKVSAADLVDRLRKRGVQAMHLYPFEAIVEQLQNLCRPGDLLVVMGAGPVWQVAKGYLEAASGAGFAK